MVAKLASPRRILVREVNWLGDLVISLPALHALRTAFPGTHLSVLIKRELAGFFDGAAWVDSVIPFTTSTGTRGLLDRWRIAGDLRRAQFDLAVIFPRSFDAAFVPALARVPVRVGVHADARGFLLTRSVRLATHDAREHQAHVYLRMLRATLGIDGDLAEHHLDVSAQHRKRMQSWLSTHRRRPAAPLIALAPAAAYGPAKQWPADHYAALINQLHDAGGAECVLVGSPSERPTCEAVAAASRHRPLVAAGETSVGEAIALLSLCAGFAGNDSGSMHVAAALGIPTVGIFGSTNPVRTGPLGDRSIVLYDRIECSPCLDRTCRFGHYECLKRITPDAVVSALRRLEALSKS